MILLTTVTDEHECDFPDTCQVCSPRTRPTPETVDYMFAAKYHTECQKCDCAIFPGDRIARMTTGRIVCEDCAGPTSELSFT